MALFVNSLLSYQAGRQSEENTLFPSSSRSAMRATIWPAVMGATSRCSTVRGDPDPLLGSGVEALGPDLSGVDALFFASGGTVFLRVIFGRKMK